MTSCRRRRRQIGHDREVPRAAVPTNHRSGTSGERCHRPPRRPSFACSHRAASQRSVVGRYYDPGTGQFLSVDPLVNETGQPYAYTGDDPVNGTDPLGLFCLGLCTFTNAAKDVGHAAGDVGHFVVTHPKVAIGIGLGVLAVATGGLGLAAAAGVEGITISATTLGVASVVAGGGAAALDYSGCFDTNGDGLSRTLACTGFATGLLGAGFGALAVALPESVFALQLGSVGLGFGIGANGLDIWNAIEGNQSSSSASACRTSK